MGTSKSRSGTGLHAAVVESLEARQLLTATVANFTGGNGTSSVDQYTGVAGGGWATAWTTDTYKTTSTAGVLSTNPLNGGGNYLSGTFTGGGTPSLAVFARAYNTVTGGVDTGQAHTISFDVRVDSDLSTFTDNQDRINIWGDDSLNYGTTSGSTSGLTWVLTAYGAATNGVPVAKNWTWQGGDRAGNYGPILDTGIPLVQGHVYHVTITNDPVSQSYVGAITDLQTNATNTSPVLGWRTGHAFTSTTNTYLMVGGEKQSASGKTTTIATDSISIAPAPPAAPSALTATAASSSQINLTWTDNAFDESGFVVDRATNSSFSSGLVSTNLAAGVTSYSSTGLSANTTYYYRMRAANGAGSSANSNPASATTQSGVAVPSAPSNLAAAASATQINLTWTDNSSNETGFKIDRATNPTFASGVTTTTVAAGSTMYSTTGLTAGSTYYFRVRATNLAGDSANSNTATARTAAPNAPSNLSATAASSSQINLAWTDNSTDETGFKVDRASNSTFTAGLTTTTVGAGTTSYSATSLPVSTMYYFRVRATNAVGDSANSNTASATTMAASAVASDAASTALVNLNWTNLGSNVMYFVCRDTQPNFQPSEINLLSRDVTSPSLTDDDVMPGTTYYYKVYAETLADPNGTIAYTFVGDATATTPATDVPLYVNGTNSQVYASEMDIQATPRVPPSATPANVNATGVNDLEILISWTTAAVNVANFDIQISADNATWYHAGTAPSAARNFVIRGYGPGGSSFLRHGATYYIRIAATNTVSSTPWSTVATASVREPDPSIALGRDILVINGGNRQPMEYLLQGVSVSPTGVLSGVGNSVGKIWLDDVRKGYNAFLTADPHDGGAPSPGMAPFSVSVDATNDIESNDGSGRLFDEINTEISRGLGDIGLIGYSHGGGMIHNISTLLVNERTSPPSFNVVFVGTIDAVAYGGTADSALTLSGWYLFDPLQTAPGLTWGCDAVNYWEPNGWNGIPIHGQSLTGATNTEIQWVDHSQIAVLGGVVAGVENAIDNTFYPLSS